MEQLNSFVQGGIALGYIVAGMFFLRFWRKSNDRLFLMFALAFGILAVQRVVLTIVGIDSEHSIILFTIRLCAFLMFLVAIIDKNYGRRETAPEMAASTKSPD